MLAEAVLQKYESKSNYMVHVNNFLSKIQTIAKMNKIVVLTDLEELKTGIADFIDRSTSIKKIMKRLKAGEGGSTSLQLEGLSHFKKQYLETCTALIQVLKRTTDEQVDWTDLAKLLGAVEVEPIDGRYGK
jgi:hypothetical protein